MKHSGSTLTEEAVKAARERLKKLRRTARITGDIMAPSGEVWNAERGWLIAKPRGRRKPARSPQT